MEKYVKFRINKNDSIKILNLYDEEIEDIDLEENEVIMKSEDILKSPDNFPFKWYENLYKKIHSMSKWRLYPIYKFSIKFKYKEDSSGPWKDNSIFNSIMYKSKRTEDQLEESVRDIINNLDSRYNNIHPIIDYSYKLLRYETWCLNWFSHYTFDIGQSDEDALDSFEKYVKRYEDQQSLPIEMINKLGDDYNCLMGAEDRWRWGHYEMDEKGNRIGEDLILGPCRCNACKKAGIIRIDH